MTTKYAANADRVLMAAEIAMASINSGTPLVTCAQTEQLHRRLYQSRRIPRKC
jgi:hypothetical protein